MTVGLVWGNQGRDGHLGGSAVSTGRLGDSGTGGDRKVKNRWESRQGHNMCEVGGVKGPGSG